jgi:hypothetical protein
VIHLESIGCPIAVKDLYDRVTFDPIEDDADEG